MSTKLFFSHGSSRQPIDTVFTRPDLETCISSSPVPTSATTPIPCTSALSFLLILEILEMLKGVKQLVAPQPQRSPTGLSALDASHDRLRTQVRPHSTRDRIHILHTEYRTQSSMCPPSEHHDSGALIYSRNSARILGLC